MKILVESDSKTMGKFQRLIRSFKGIKVSAFVEGTSQPGVEEVQPEVEEVKQKKGRGKK